MAKFFAGLLIGALSMLGYHHFASSSESETSQKDTITIQMADQTFEVPDTTKKDSAK